MKCEWVKKQIKSKKAAVQIAAALFVVTVLVLSGCKTGNQKNVSEEVTEETNVSNVPSTEEKIKETAETETAAGQKTEETKTEEQKEPFKADRSEVYELFSHINIGWNLGNTLDATGAGNSLSAETYWGNPKTTQEMFDAVAGQGFRAVRIPVTYAEHMGKAPDYKIDTKWLDRVQEVVDYALNAGLYVLLDTHHEPNYWLKPDRKHEEEAVAQLGALWSQVAERFRDYDEKLLFEGMNEPRIKGSANEWNGGTESERKVVDHLNQTFVDAVRKTGGNNEKRILILCTYGNCASYGGMRDFKIPEDNYIAVAVHMYTPYQFTYDTPDGGYSAWDGSRIESITGVLNQIQKNFLNRGLPVIITEFGAVNKQNTKDVIAWIEDYLGAMNQHEIKCFWWDNNIYDKDGEKFGIFDRGNLTWYNQDIADALIENSIYIPEE